MVLKKMSKSMSMLLIMTLIIGLVPQTARVAFGEGGSSSQEETVAKTVYGEVYLEGEYYDGLPCVSWDKDLKGEIDGYDENEDLQKYFKKMLGARQIYSDEYRGNSDVKKSKREITLGIKRSDLLEDIKIINEYLDENDEWKEEVIADKDDMKVIRSYKENAVFATDSKIKYDEKIEYNHRKIKVELKRKNEDKKTIEIKIKNLKMRVEDIPTKRNMDISKKGLYEVQVRGLELNSNKIEDQVGEHFSWSIARYRVEDEQNYLEVGYLSIATGVLMDMEIYVEGKKTEYTSTIREYGKHNTTYYKVPVSSVDSEIKMSIPYAGKTYETRIVIWKNTFKAIENDEKETEKEKAVRRLEEAIAKEIEKEKYTEESYKKYEDAFKNAKAVNKETAKVEEIKKAADDLEKTIDELKIKEGEVNTNINVTKDGEYEVDIDMLFDDGKPNSILPNMIEDKAIYVVKEDKKYVRLKVKKAAEQAFKVMPRKIFIDGTEVASDYEKVDGVSVIEFEVNKVDSEIKMDFANKKHVIVLDKDTFYKIPVLVDDISKSGLYKLEIKGLKDDNDEESMAAQYVGREGTDPINVAKIEVKDGKREFIVNVKRSDWMHDIKIEVNGKIVPHHLKVIKTYENMVNEEGKHPTDSEMRFEIPNIDAKIRMYLQALPMGLYEKVFRMIPQKNTLKLLEEYEETEKEKAIKKLQDIMKVSVDKNKKYTEESYKTYENALEAAKTIDTKTATVQEIYKAAKVLEEAIAGLEEKIEITIDKNHLQQDIKGITDKKKKIVINKITKELAEKANVTVEVGSIKDATIKVQAKLNTEGKKEAILPKLEITSNYGNVTMTAGTKIVGDKNWDETIKMPSIVTEKLITKQNSIQTAAIKVGSENGTLTFDQPVKIVFSGQAGKKVAYITNGKAPVEITHTLLANQNNTRAAKDAMDKTNVGEAKLDVNGDLIVWTTHFTTFVMYEETTDNPSGPGSHSDVLEDGEYDVCALALQENSNEESMTNPFIKNTTINVKDGKITAKMVWKGTAYITMNLIKELKYKNSNGEFVDANRSYNAGNDTLTIKFEVEDINKATIFRVYVPEGMGESRPKFRLFLGDVAQNMNYSSNDLEHIVNGFYEADIKILKENEEKTSTVEPYFLKKADVEVKDNKKYVRLFIKNKEDIKDLKVKVDGNDVEYQTKIIKEYDNGKKASMIKFEIPNLDASIKLKAKVVPEDNKEVTFRVLLEQHKFKKKTDESIYIYIKLLEGKIIKEVDLSEDGLYEMNMEVVKTDENLLAMVKKCFNENIYYDVRNAKNYVQVMLKNKDEIKDIKVYVNSMNVKYEKINSNEKITAIRFEVPDADAKIRFSICMTEKKEQYTGFSVGLKKDTARKIEEKIYLYIHLPNITNVKSGEIKNIKLDVAPVLENNRTLVPLRGVCETLGLKVLWQESTRSILLSNEDMKIHLYIDSRDAEVNGKNIKMDVAPKVINDRTFIPLRFISENLKHHVKWIKEEEKIVITKSVDTIEKMDITTKANQTK